MSPSFSLQMECQTSNHSVITCHFKLKVQKWRWYLPLKMKFVFPMSFWWLVIRTGSKPGVIFSKSSHAGVYTIKQYFVSRKSLSHNSPKSPSTPKCWVSLHLPPNMSKEVPHTNAMSWGSKKVPEKTTTTTTTTTKKNKTPATSETRIRIKFFIPIWR